MVDVTMTLLIFFMVTTRMVEQENSVIDLPAARSAQDAEKHELGTRFVVNVHDTTTEGSAGARYIVQDKEISLPQLNDRLKQEKRLDPEVNCVIRGDRSLSYQHVQAVMVGCAQAGIERITFGATPRSGGTN